MGDSIVTDDSTFVIEKKVIRSMIGNGPQILTSDGMISKWQRLMAGKNTALTPIFRNYRQASDSHDRNQINEAFSN